MSTSPLRIGVLAVQGDVREHLNALSILGAQVVGVRRPRELDDVDALVIPGGESTTMDKLVRAFDLQDPLRKRISAGMPVYGSCAGMIMLADRIADSRPDQETLGGLDITVRRNAFGRQVDSFEEDLHIPEIAERTSAPQDHPATFKAVFIRAPWVEEMGDDVQVLATVEAGPAQGRVVAIRSGNLLATSFHPEVTGDHRIHEYFMQMVRSSLQ
ncbi:MAG TPA: pyridoxal 5'-phosphate synthase glutaminase subunit PdxT [Dermatophilaceae bacterium]